MMRRPGKSLLPVRMIPWEDDYLHVAAMVLFGSNHSVYFWLKGEPMPAELVPQLVNEVCRNAKAIAPTQQADSKPASKAELGGKPETVDAPDVNAEPFASKTKKVEAAHASQKNVTEHVKLQEQEAQDDEDARRAGKAKAMQKQRYAQNGQGKNLATRTTTRRQARADTKRGKAELGEKPNEDRDDDSNRDPLEA